MSQTLAAPRITEGVIWKQLLSFFFPILLGTFFQQLYNTVDAIVVGRAVGTQALAAVGATSALINLFNGFFIGLSTGAFFQQLYNTVDAIVVGRAVGTQALAAVGATSALINLFNGFFIGLSTGATVLLSQLYGGDNLPRSRDSLHTGMALSVVLGLAAMALGVFTGPALLRQMHTPENCLADAEIYVRIYFLGALASMVYNMGSGILRAMGDSRRPVVFLAVACGVNIVLDLVCVVWLKMGIAGAALATIGYGRLPAAGGVPGRGLRREHCAGPGVRGMAENGHCRRRPGHHRLSAHQRPAGAALSAPPAGAAAAGVEDDAPRHEPAEAHPLCGYPPRRTAIYHLRPGQRADSVQHQFLRRCGHGSLDGLRQNRRHDLADFRRFRRVHYHLCGPELRCAEIPAYPAECPGVHGYGPGGAFGVSITTFVGQNFGAQKYQRIRQSVRVCMGMGLAMAAGMSGLELVLRRFILGIYTTDPEVIAQKYQRIRQSVRVCMGMGLAMAAGMSGLELVLRRFILGIYTTDPEVIAAGAYVMLCIIPFNVVFTPVEVFAGAMRGTGYSIVPTVITCTCVCLFRVVWIWLVVERWHHLGVLAMAYPLSWVLCAIVFTCLFRVVWIWLVVERWHHLGVLAMAYPLSWVLCAIVFTIAYLRGTWLHKRIAQIGLEPEQPRHKLG